ncbi:MAG: hypothetical protein H2049_07960 [Porphyrobacter sp.]|nr:hypothetical protein [Porphyrobacter sp.]
MLTDWSQFLDLKREDQANFLLDLAKKSLPFLINDDNIKSNICRYVDLAESVISGDIDKFDELLVFLNDEKTGNDFSDYFNILIVADYDSTKELAVVDICSYACGFVCLYTAEKLGIKGLPDPVLQSTADEYEYYKEKSELLRI